MSEASTKSVLVIWTITFNPKDYPGEFVARPSAVGTGGKLLVGKNVKRGKTLDAVQKQLPPGLMRFPRDPGDDPVIVETWM